jgi:ligand-binding sensor domain-containing protein/serine phosphatase RsbU (regulator of sigma subunit)
LLLASCYNDKQSASDEIPPLYPAPQTVALNTEEGYVINQVTGDSIQPIINSMGDTVKTGVPIPASGKVTDPSLVVRAEVIPAGKPLIVPANLNVHKIPETFTVITINKASQKTFTPGVDTSTFVLVNSTGDTIPTGVPIPITGKVIPSIQPIPVQAFPPRKNDNASINMTYLDVEQGMNTSYVFSILEDRRGNLWFGTGREGVSMYNGETFTHFSENEGLSSNYIRSILEDSHGNLWFGTYVGGVSMYNGESFTHFTEKEGLSSNNVWSILEDSHGNFWIGTDGGGVSMYNGKTITHFTKKEGLSDNQVYSILEDSHGNLWFGTFDGGVSMYDGESFSHFTENEGLSNNWVRSIFEDSQGNLWFGTGGGGVSMYNGETFTHFTTKEGLCNNYVYSILEDSQGNFWFGTNGGVSIYNGETFTHFTENEGLSSNNLRSILEDNHGNLWFGTEGGGVGMYKGETFMHFTKKEGLSDNLVNSILEDSHGNLWFGTREGGVSMYDGESFTHYTAKEGLISNNVRSIMEESNGNLWFGTGGGVSMYNGVTFTQFTENEGLSDNRVRVILEDSHGNLWFGAREGGISMYNGETLTHFTTKEGLSHNDIWCMLEDSNGNLWIGTTGGGVSLFNGETFTHFTEKEGLSDNWVLSILEDSHGNLWFGTEGGGVSMYNGETFTHFTTKEGLSNNNIRSIIEDSNSNIWLGTLKGLNHLVFDPASISGKMNSLFTSSITQDSIKVAVFNPEIHNYGKQDGLKGMDFYPNSVLLDSKNRLWWGSGQSLIMLDSHNLPKPAEVPTMQLNRIEINEQFVDYHHLKGRTGTGMKFDDVAKFYNYPLNLELPHSSNHLAFYFSAIDWSAPHKLKYSHKMEGVNDHWTLPKTEAKADYRHMPYGTFTFKVRAIGEAQKWSEPFEYTFTILPPWWHTWWAKTGYGITTLLLIIGIIRWRTSSLKQRQKELVTEVVNSTKEIRAQKFEVESQRDQLVLQRDLVVEQKQEITDSINYAQRIQTAVLPNQEYMDAVMPEYFVLYKPRDIVSGDFYWVKEVQDHLVIVGADCTGHGVPGALMSMLGITLLDDLIGDRCFDAPSAILERLRQKIKELLVQEGNSEEQKDGIDMVIVIYNKTTKELLFSGANNPLYIIRNKKLMTGSELDSYASKDNEDYQLFDLKGDKQPIGFYWTETKFTTKYIPLQKGDSIYLFTDGFVDQKGGPKNKKFLSTNFKKSLLDIQTLSMDEQKQSLDDTLENWRKGLAQVDDVLVMGIRIN